MSEQSSGIPTTLAIVSTAALLVIASCPSLGGEYRKMHRRACAAELRAARTLRDTLAVVVADAKCADGVEGSPLRAPQETKS